MQHLFSDFVDDYLSGGFLDTYYHHSCFYHRSDILLDVCEEQGDVEELAEVVRAIFLHTSYAHCMRTHAHGHTHAYTHAQ
jgi:hypothetical protein